MSDPTLEDLDAVGPSQADRLREHGFASVDSLLGTTPATLVEIDGIDEATATDILASAVRLTDRSEPTASTRRLGPNTPVLGPVRSHPLPRRPVERPPVSEHPRSTDVPTGRGRPGEDDVGTRPRVSGTVTGSGERRLADAKSIRETLELAGRLVDQAAAGGGRLGRTSIDPSSVTANVTVRYRASDYFDADAHEVLAGAGVPKRDVARLLEHETSVLERLESDPTFAAGYTLDPRAALAALDDPLGERLAPLVPRPIRRRPVILSPVTIGTMRVQVADGDADGGR
jgi:hypothetical protein